jgi:hypothetical protein
MTYYKTSRRSHTPISDAAVFFSNEENYNKVFKRVERQKQRTQEKNQSLEKVKEILIK